MESKAKRTLVKSAPELWELADDLERMRAWLAGVAGRSEPPAVELTAREPERLLAWRGAGAEPEAAISLELSESGFGTAVLITARHSHPEPAAAAAALEGLLDELGSPERRPFAAA